MCTSCALAPDSVDDGERCISLDTWHGDANVGSISPHVRVRMCEVAFVIECGHPCGETSGDIFVSAVALRVWE